MGGVNYGVSEEKMATKNDVKQQKEDEIADKRMYLLGDEVKDEDVQKSFAVVEKGTVVRRVRRGQLRPAVLIRLSEDHDCVFYKSPKSCFGSGKTKQVLLSSLVDVRRGWATDRFMKMGVKTKFASKVNESCCFSVVYRDRAQCVQKSADFVAETPDERKHWLIALWRILTDTREASIHFNEQAWLKKSFASADTNKNGRLSFNEVTELMKKLNVQISVKDLRRQFLICDIHKDATEDFNAPALDFEEFELLFRSLTKRAELKAIMRRYSKLGVDQWTAEDLQGFLTKSQGFEVSLDECKTIIQNVEPDASVRSTGQLCVQGFRLLLLSKWGALINPDHTDTVFQDMTRPLCEYFINSTHNTYLLGHQLLGDATIEGYIAALKNGARMLELDIWAGKDDQLVVTHGYTLVNPIPLKYVLRAVSEYAFYASPYPLILSLENHCDLDEQVKVAYIFQEIIGDKLFVPVSATDALMSPEALQNRILLKCKRSQNSLTEENVGNKEEDEFFYDVYDAIFGGQQLQKTQTDETKMPDIPTLTPSGFDELTVADKAKKKPEKIPIAWQFSELIGLKAFKLRDVTLEIEEHPWNSHVSLTESKAKDLLEEEFDWVIRYTSRHLMKVYPSGKRADSTNMHPTKFWIAGIQNVTMNVQTDGEELDLNGGLFSINKCCGYVLKPKWMRSGAIFSPDTNRITNVAFPARYADLMNRDAKMTLRVQVISAQCLPRPETKYSDNIVDPYVTMEIFGYPFDNQKHRTAVINNNGFNPVWNSKYFAIVLKVPELALLRFCVKDHDRFSSNDFIGQYTLPAMSVTPGYSHIPLLTGADHLKDPAAALFVHIEIDCSLSEKELTGTK